MERLSLRVLCGLCGGPPEEHTPTAATTRGGRPETASHLAPHSFGSAAFGLSLACMAHERQYSRLFRS